MDWITADTIFASDSVTQPPCAASESTKRPHLEDYPRQSQSFLRRWGGEEGSGSSERQVLEPITIYVRFSCSGSRLTLAVVEHRDREVGCT